VRNDPATWLKKEYENMKETHKYRGKIESLKLGDTESVSIKLTEQDIDRFADAIDSHHPIHMSTRWVDGQTQFGEGRLIHGVMTAALVSRVIVSFLDRHDLKGAICYTQSKFISPVRAGDTITIKLTYLGLVPGKPRLRCSTEVRNEANQLVMAGEIHEHIFIDQAGI
jgi:phosphate acetyltransferase/phosphate butyryltransferase